MESAGAHPRPHTGTAESRRLMLGLMSLVLVLAMSTWFSASAVIPQLESAWSLTPTAKAWLTIAVQLGFVAGAITAATLNLSDIVSARIVILGGAIGASVANIGLVVADGAGVGIPLRFATGFFLASVYPPAFKLVATWFREGRGLALGIVAGAIIVGNAAPHLVNAVGGVDWRNVIIVTSILSASAGLLATAIREGPYPFPSATFDPRQVARVFQNRGVRLASVGYFGHMWELFAMYAWFLVFITDHLRATGETVVPAAALATFAVISIGAIGCVVGGRLSDRWGRTNTTTLMLAVSGACSLTIGLTYGGPTIVLLVVGAIWGFTVVADSAQFSAMVTEVGDQSYIGTALTMQLAIGFTVTVATIWLIPLIEVAIGWRWAFAMLALGPIVGIAAMRKLRALPEASQIAAGLR